MANQNGHRLDAIIASRPSERFIEEFRQRAQARLVLLPPHDPQFRRNRERVARDAERENLLLEWDLGLPPDEEIVDLGQNPSPRT